MEHQRWVRLDNASNIFLAARTATDTKVFRLTAEMSEEIDLLCLQKALDHIYDEYLLYHSVLRRGVFWYYLEMSDLRPKIAAEMITPCTDLYHFDKKELLFRVLYHHKRIHLEVFHVLSDGTGASWFFEDLLKEYIRLRYPERFAVHPGDRRKELDNQLQDSFQFYFRQKDTGNFTDSALSAYKSVIKTSRKAGKIALRLGKQTTAYINPSVTNKEKKHVYQIKGKKTPDHRPRAVEISLPVKEALQVSRKLHVSLTIYLTALFFEAVRKAAHDFRATDTIVISVPINLRQFYTSSSARNFFSTTYLEYTYGNKEDTVKEICEELDKQLKKSLEKENLEARLNRLISSEYNPLGRVIPRPIKDLVLKEINRRNNRKLTIAMSNLGKVVFPESMSDMVKELFFQTSVVRPQFCMISYEDRLTITISSPFVETVIQKEFVRLLTAEGIDTTVAANKVTAAELEGKKNG